VKSQPSAIDFVSVPGAADLGELTPGVPGAALGADQIARALRESIWPEPGGPGIPEIPRPGESVCVVVSDHTRKTAAAEILPVLFGLWRERGIALRDVFLLIASGIHRHPSPRELRTILGDPLYTEFKDRIRFHDPDDRAQLVQVGATARGHTVRINRHAMQADCRILFGAAVYHYHAGFGGGRKSLVPGLAARATIRHNHSLTLHPREDRIHERVAPGILDGNPVAEEMLEAAYLCGPAAIVNSVLSHDGRLAGLFSGELDLAHRAACRRAAELQRVELAQQADFVLASAGTARDWIQSHKALFNASRAVHGDGWIVLHAPCPEGLGNARFRHWIGMPELGAIFAGLRESPEVLGQTALSTKTRGRRTILITKMQEPDLRALGIETAPDWDTAVQRVIGRLNEKGVQRPCFYRMPHARYTVPFPAGS